MAPKIEVVKSQKIKKAGAKKLGAGKPKKAAGKQPSKEKAKDKLESVKVKPRSKKSYSHLTKEDLALRVSSSESSDDDRDDDSSDVEEGFRMSSEDEDEDLYDLVEDLEKMQKADRKKAKKSKVKTTDKDTGDRMVDLFSSLLGTHSTDALGLEGDDKARGAVGAVGLMSKDSNLARQVDADQTRSYEESKLRSLKRKTRLAREEIGHTLAFDSTKLNQDKSLKKLATRGIVRLLNAIKTTQQKVSSMVDALETAPFVSTELKAAAHPKAFKEALENSRSKNKMASMRDVPDIDFEADDEEASAANPKSRETPWLKDGFIESSLAAWDQASSDDEAQGGPDHEQHLGNTEGDPRAKKIRYAYDEHEDSE